MVAGTTQAFTAPAPKKGPVRPITMVTPFISMNRELIPTVPCCGR
jgi:hypothetical protein